MKNGELLDETDEKMEKCLQKIGDTVGSKLQGMNTTIVKMKEEGDDRYKQISERIANMEKRISDIDEKLRKQKAVATGFHSETSEAEVEQLLKETITEIGMSIENERIECPAKSNDTMTR